jgi:hypothetical protein
MAITPGLKEIKMKTVSRFETVTKTATSVAKSWTNNEIAMFHYFNPNGLIAAKRITDEKIDKLVDEGKAKSGSIIAHGGLNYFYYDKLAKLIDKKRVNSIKLSVIIKGLKRDIESAEKFISEQV